MKVKFNIFFTNSENSDITKNIIATFIIKGLSVLISLITLPAYFKYFKNHIVLGLWFTILSVLSLVLSFDFGIGNGLRNMLVAAIVEKNKKNIDGLISSAYLINGLLCFLIYAIGFFLLKFLNLNSIFNISKDIISEKILLNVIRIVLAGILSQLFLGLISSIIYALQKSALNNITVLIASILQLLFIIFAPLKSIEENLQLLSIAYICCTNVPLLLVTIYIFSKEFKGLYPSIFNINRHDILSVLKTGTKFFINQITFMLIINTNEIFIAKYFNPKYVVDYQVYNKIFGLVGMLFMIALTPLWSAITKAFHENKYHWLNASYKTFKIVAISAIFLELLIIPFSQVLINIWLKNNNLKVNYSYALVFAIWGSVLIYHTVLSTFVCGLGELKLQAVFYTIGILFKISVIPMGVEHSNNSWIIVIIANIIILLSYCILQDVILNKRLKSLLVREYK